MCYVVVYCREKVSLKCYSSRTQQDLEIVEILLKKATALLNEVYEASGMSESLAQQFEQLKKRIEKFRREQKMMRPNVAQKQQHEIIDKLRREVEEVVLLLRIGLFLY